ncbi:MAG: hypothetical protein GXO03_03755 [Aquificae bacterium]|nr:hypothetical protein [Aquificota bacterium]
MRLLSFLIWGGLSFGACGLDFPVELKYKVEDKVGKEYRRADVVVYVPVTGRSVPKGEGEAELEAEAKKGELVIHIKPKKNFSEWFLFIPVKKGYLHEEAYLEKVYSRSPSMKEVYHAYPVDITREGTFFLLPPSTPGEKLVLKIKYEGEVGKPRVFTSRPEQEEKSETVKVIYSFAFGYAKTETDNMNLKNVKKLIEQLAKSGKLAKVEIVGYADGKSTDPERNEQVAKERALSVARKLFSEHSVACLLSEKGIAKLPQETLR